MARRTNMMIMMTIGVTILQTMDHALKNLVRILGSRTLPSKYKRSLEILLETHCLTIKLTLLLMMNIKTHKIM